MAHKSGKEGKVKVDATDLNITAWSRSETMPTEDTTDTGDDGYRNSVNTIREASGTVEADWDAASRPHDDPPDIVTGSEVALYLYVGDPADDKKYTHPIAVVTEVSTNSAVRGKVSYSFSWESRGSWTYPS